MEENEPLHTEFFVEEDRKVCVTFYDEEMKPVADQEVKATSEASSGKTTLEFKKKDDYLLSKTELPEGDEYTVVVQIKVKPDAKSQNFRTFTIAQSAKAVIEQSMLALVKNIKAMIMKVIVIN